MTDALLTLTNVARYFDVSPPWLNRVLEGKGRVILKAVDGINLAIRKGETLGLVGESGCGKSTVARVIVGLYAPTRGTVRYDGEAIAGEGAITDARALRRKRRGMQMIFQDPTRASTRAGASRTSWRSPFAATRRAPRQVSLGRRLPRSSPRWGSPPPTV
jgi:ABC-type oligopeptide transport system ATPase subunit